MKNILFYDVKEYEKPRFEEIKGGLYFFDYIESKLNEKTAVLARGYDAVCIFVNDSANEKTLKQLKEYGIGLLLLRCSGFNQVDMRAAEKLGISVLRVPGYSPYSVAEHAVAMLLTLNRKIHKAYIRTRDFNFSLNHLIGFDLHGKRVGVIGTGRIGRVFIDICKGFGMDVVCYDPYPDPENGLHYVSTDELFSTSDVISLHCPLTESSYHIIDKAALSRMKPTCVLINTSRGALVDSEALLAALTDKKLGGACLDVYEEESNLFYEDNSITGVEDRRLALLLARPNVIVTSHQAYLTQEALNDIANQTRRNLDDYFSKKVK